MHLTIRPPSTSGCIENINFTATQAAREIINFSAAASGQIGGFLMDLHAKSPFVECSHHHGGSKCSSNLFASYPFHFPPPPASEAA